MEIYDKTNNKKELEKIILYSKNFIKNKSEIIIYEGRFLFKNEKYKEVIKILESISFNEDQINLEHLRVLTLGKTYDHLKNPEKAFKYFVESNDIDFKIKNKKINKNIYLEIIKRREKYFKSYKLDRKIKPNLAKEKIGPFFMIGFPRSGTTLLDTILRSHPSVEVIEEKPIVEKLIYNLNKITKNNLQNLKKINKEQIQDLKKIYYKSLESNISKKNNNKIYIDKLPLNIIYVGEILKIFPNAKFIFSLRHPCDCVLSCFMQNFKINNAMANFLNIEDSAYLYDNVMKLWTIYLSNFTINFKQVRYEDLINNFNDTVKSVLKFLELPWSDSVLNYSETANKRSQIKTPSYDQVIKPIYTTASGRWKLYEKQISSIYPILEHWIKEFGY